MKKLKLTKMIASLLLAVSLVALNPIGASAEWRQDGKGWWYTENDSWATGWRQIDSKWYYFKSDGYMAHNTAITGYTLGSDGAWDGSTIKILLNKDDFNNFGDSNASNQNFIDWTKQKGYDWSYSVVYPNNGQAKFKTSRNVGLGDSLEDIGKAYNVATNHLLIIGSDDVCSNYPNWKSLNPTHGLDMGYFDEDGTRYDIIFYLNSSNKVVMIAYFKNLSYMNKNYIIWS